MTNVDSLIKKTYAAIVYGNCEAALRYLEEVRKAIENEDKQNPTVEKVNRSFNLPRFWLAFKPKLPVLLRHW